MACSTIWLILVTTTSFKLQDRECLGEPDSAGKTKEIYRLAEAGSLPPAWLGPHQTHPCFFTSLLPGRCPGEKHDTDGKIKVGRLKSHFFQKKKKRLNSRSLYLLSVEVNKVLGLQICWYGGLDDVTTGWVGREPGRPPAPTPAGPPGGFPSVSRRHLATARHAVHGARSPGPAESCN